MTERSNAKALKLSQTITFPSIINKTCTDSVFTIPVFASSGLSVTLEAKTGNVLIKENKITITGAGTVIIEASQPGDDIYEAAIPVTNRFEVSSSFFTDQKNFSIKIDTSLCTGDIINFSATSISGISYNWNGLKNINSDNNTLVIHDIDESYSGKLYLKIWQAKCLFFNESFNIVINPKPQVSITGVSDKVSKESPPVQLKTFPSNGILSGDGITNDQFDPAKAGLGQHVILYTYIDNNQCSNRASITITVTNDDELKIYELITSRPGSNHNIWRIENIEKYNGNEVFVYTTWGSLVYSAKNYSNEKGWDGAGLPAGAYLYVVKTSEQNQLKKGTLFIDRD